MMQAARAPILGRTLTPIAEAERMTLCCRPRAGGDLYAAARRCGAASDNRNFGGYGSPPARGRQRL